MSTRGQAPSSTGRVDGGGSVGFGDPMLDIALVILHVEEKKSMGIAPIHLGDRDIFERRRLQTIGRAAVVS